MVCRGFASSNLIAAVVGVVALAGAVFGLIGYGESQGRAEVQAKWDKSIADAKDVVASDARFGRQQADQLRTKLLTLEKNYAATNIQLSQALRKQVVCPASGEVGDVVLPADMVRGMFNVPAGDPPRSP